MYLSEQNSRCGRELERRQLRLGLALHCPRLEGNRQDSAGHDKSREAHTDGEGEHGVQLVVLDGLDNVAGLQKIVSLIAFHQRGAEDTYTQHEDQSTGDQTKRRDDLSWGARRQVGGWRLDVEQDIGCTTSQGKSHKKVAPLLVYHSRNHAILVMRTHHHTQEQNYQSGHRVERHTLSVREFPVDIR